MSAQDRVQQYVNQLDREVSHTRSPPIPALAIPPNDVSQGAGIKAPLYCHGFPPEAMTTQPNCPRMHPPVLT